MLIAMNILSVSSCVVREWVVVIIYRRIYKYEHRLRLMAREYERDAKVT